MDYGLLTVTHCRVGLRVQHQEHIDVQKMLQRFKKQVSKALERVTATAKKLM